MADNLALETGLVVDDPRWTERMPDAEALAEAALRAGLAGAGLSGAVTVDLLLATDDRIRELNRDFRGFDKPTNVLSFPADAMPIIPGAPHALGDIALAFETVSQEADDAGLAITAHLQHLIVHASLHLIGYTHDGDEDAAAMESLEIAVLAGLGIPNPYGDAGDGQAIYGTREQ